MENPYEKNRVIYSLRENIQKITATIFELQEMKDDLLHMWELLTEEKKGKKKENE